MRTSLGVVFVLKHRFIGQGRHMEKEGTFFLDLPIHGVVAELRWLQARSICSSEGMQQANGVETPRTKGLCRSARDRPTMTAADTQRNGRTVARINYMAQDRWDLASAICAQSQRIFEEHLVSLWSKGQATIALSSGEAELSALIKGLSARVAIRSCCKNFVRWLCWER